tara:strand:- start:6177 stop:9218 length:3042 start_codon:yes stop_codon:yes gene_type:complete
VIENSSFNSYLSNPEYIKSMLILEALRISLREVSPGRKKKAVKEAIDAPVSKEQQRLAFAHELEQFAMYAVPPSKTGKLSNEEKQQQEQRDLFIVSLQTIADKLQHVGTAFAKEQETQLTTLERDIVKLMRHAQQAGMLDDVTDKIKTRIVNKGVELYGPALLAQREELRGDPEIRRGDWEVEKEIEKEKEQPMDKTAKKSVKETDMIQSRREVTPEGNEFVKARLDAIKAGKKHFTVGGKTFQITGDTRDEFAKGDQAVLGEMHDSLEFDVEVERDPHTDVKHYEYQASMSRSELYRNAKYAMSMMNQVQVNEEVEPWIAGALTKAANYLDKIYHYLDYYQTFEPEKLPEDLDGDMDLGETSGSITRQHLMMIVEYSTKLFEMIKPGDHLEGWVAMKLTTASECISSAKHYLDYKHFEMHALDDHFQDARAGKSRQLAEQALKRGRRRHLREQQDLAQAETLLAAKDLSNQLQQTAEKIAKMSVEDLMPLVDVMREQFGPEAAQGFNDVVKASLENLLSTTSDTKYQVDTSIETLQQGGIPGQQEQGLAPDVELAGEEIPGDDELGEPPVEEPGAEAPLGRSKKSDLAETWDDDWGSDQETADDAYEIGYQAGVNNKPSSANPFQGKDSQKATKWQDGHRDGRQEPGLMEAKHGKTPLEKSKSIKKPHGKWDSHTLSQLKAAKKKLMDKESRSKQEHKDVKEINAAIQAKSKPAKVDENIMGMDAQTRYDVMSRERLDTMAKQGDSRARQELSKRGPAPAPSLAMKPSVTGVSDPYELASDDRLRSMTARGDQKAKAEMDKRRQPVKEVAPPGEKAERFIRQNKEKFSQQYGDRAEEVLYATAWKQFGIKQESYKKNQTRLESTKQYIRGLEKLLQEHRGSWKQQLAEGTVVDPLNTGYGLEGEIVAGKLSKARAQKTQLETWLAASRNQGIHQLQEQVATVQKIRKLTQARAKQPWGVAFIDQNGQQHQKFFESQDNAKLWRDLNAKDIKVLQMFGPRDFDKKVAQLRGTL